LRKEAREGEEMSEDEYYCCENCGNDVFRFVTIISDGLYELVAQCTNCEEEIQLKEKEKVEKCTR
jgi:hypothetical protein